jgi:hypothetical protein
MIISALTRGAEPGTGPRAVRFPLDQGAEQPGDLLLTRSGSIELAAHLGEPVVHARTEAVDVSCEVGQVLAHRVENAVVLLPELPGFPPYLGHVPICATSEYPGGGGVL